MNLDQWEPWLLKTEFSEFEKKWWIHWPFKEIEGREKWRWALSSVMQFGMDENWRSLRYALRLEDLNRRVTDLMAESRWMECWEPSEENVEGNKEDIIEQQRLWIEEIMRHLQSKQHHHWAWQWYREALKEGGQVEGLNEIRKQWGVQQLVYERLYHLAQKVQKLDEESQILEGLNNGQWNPQEYEIERIKVKKKWDLLRLELVVLSQNWKTNYDQEQALLAQWEAKELKQELNYEDPSQSDEDKGESEGKKSKRL